MRFQALFDLNSTFSVVDVETTGGKSAGGHIIEIGIVTVKNRKIVDTYSSFIRPVQNIPPFITELTGIRDKDVADAPPFLKIKNEIRSRLEGNFFVAHNVNFDYRCLKTEFQVLGEHFYMDRFCTVKLGRIFFPGHKHYNLDAMIDRLHIPVSERHRSAGDAAAAAGILITYLHHPDAEKTFSLYARSFDKKEKWLERLELQIAELPNAKGVYLFKDIYNLPLYIGKSNHIRSRIFSHLREDDIPRKKRLFHHTDHFDFIECASELEALILESRLIKKHLPPHNIEQTARNTYTFLKITGDPYPRVWPTQTKNEQDGAEYIGPFRSSKFVEFLLDKIQRHFKLCPELMKERRAKKGFCFSYRLNLCCGACGGAVGAEEYGKLVRGAVDAIAHFIHMEKKETIDAFLKSRSAKTPELDKFRSAIRRVKKQMKEIPGMFHEKYVVLHENENIGYFIQNGLLEKILRSDELENSEWKESLANSIQTKTTDDRDALDERLTIQRFVKANRNKIKIITLSS